MARIRTIKPEFFLHERLAELSALHRLLFIGLWTLADRDGRLEDRPKRIKAAILPYDNRNVDIMLGELHEHGFITRYDGPDGGEYIEIPAFAKHQRVSGREAAIPSEYPPPPSGSNREAFGKHSGSNREAPECSSRAGDGREGKGKEGKGTETPRACVPPATGVPDDPYLSDAGESPAKRYSAGHVWRSRRGVSVPSFLHREFVEKLGAAGTEADVLRWYADTEASLGQQPIGDDPIVFWRARFREWQGTTVKPLSVAKPSVADHNAAMFAALKAVKHG